MKSPTLKHFILRAEFIQAYRSAVRATRPLPDPQTRRETLDYLRSDIERLRNEYSLAALEHSLSHFRKLVKQMAPSFSLTGLSEGGGAKLVGQKRRPANPFLD